MFRWWLENDIVHQVSSDDRRFHLAWPLFTSGNSNILDQMCIRYDAGIPTNNGELMATWQMYMDNRIAGNEKPMPWFLHDKLKCYRWCEENGIPTAEVIREFARPEEIDLSGLEGTFVLKPTLQSSMKGVMVLTPTAAGFHDELKSRDLTVDEILEEQTRLFEETRSASKKIIVERRIDDADKHEIPLDYKAYAFNGEIALILQVDRNGPSSVTSWFDGNFDPITDDRVSYIETFKHHTNAPTPANSQEMLEVARKASSFVPTPFARIDMYSTTRGVIVGEITLVPGGLFYGTQYYPSTQQQELMGQYWELALHRIGRSDEILEPSSLHGKDLSEFDLLTDIELVDIGMHRCPCGKAHYPDGDPGRTHCEFDSQLA